MSEGVLQGEVVSPLLFIFFRSGMIVYFRERNVRGIGVNSMCDLLMLLYADDLVILAYSSIDLKRKLTFLDDYCNENGLTVSTQKTQVMVFKAGG